MEASTGRWFVVDIVRSPVNSTPPWLRVGEDDLRDSRELHEACAFVDLADLGVAVELLDGVVLYEAGAAEDFDGERRYALGYLGGEELGTWRLL